METEERAELAKMIHAEFKADPVNQHQTQIVEARRSMMPLTWTEWAKFVIAVITICGGISWAVVKVNKLSLIADQRATPWVETQLAQHAEKIAANKKAHEEHDAKKPIHQSQESKDLATMKTMKPIETSIINLENKVDNMEINMNTKLSNILDKLEAYERERHGNE